ncbi:MAG: hypothetical protein JO015_11840 [Verrucomicrobia bacterium]|nr:hypothetical protein [Verrucomicrobiota bacterium]
MKPFLTALALLAALPSTPLSAQEPGSDGKIMLTVFLRHDQSKTLDEINRHLDQTGFRRNFPPPGVEILSYHIVMGIGHVITLRLPPEKLREVNLAFEKGVWGAFRTEYYPTYDYLPVFNETKKKDAAPAESRTQTPGNSGDRDQAGGKTTPAQPGAGAEP